MQPETIISDYDKLTSKKSQLLRKWDDLSKYVLPSHSRFLSEAANEETERQEDVYDTTAMRANEVLASSLHGGLTPPTAEWFKLSIRNKEIDKTGKLWLETAAKKALSALNESNFITAISRSYLDLGAFCTAALWLDDESKGLTFGRLKFTNIHLKNLVFQEGVSGKAEFVWIESKMPAINAVNMYDSAKMPMVAKKASEDKTRHEDVKFIIYCAAQMADDGSVKGYKTVVVSREDKAIVDTKISVTAPFMVVRWQQSTGEVWGTGCGMRALPDIRVINQAKYMELSAYDESINRGYVTTQRNLVNNDIDRKGVTIVQDINKLKPLNEGSYNWNVVQLKGEEIQSSIRSMFYEDRLVLPQTTGDTATEFRIRYDLLQRQLAPIMGRLQVELLNPIIERVIALMVEGGALTSPPSSITDDDSLDIEYTAPLVRSRQSQEIEAINQWVGSIAGLVELYPNIRHIIDDERIGRRMAEALDIPAEIINDAEKVAEMVQKDMEQRERQIAMEREARGLPPEQTQPQEPQ